MFRHWIESIKRINSADDRNPHKAKVGALYAILGNIFYGIGNLVTAGYPTTPGLLFWRGLGVSSFTLTRRPKFNRYSVTLGIIHASHMVTYVSVIRIGPAWFGAAALSAVPAIAWLTRRNGSYVGGILVFVMLIAGVIFALDPSSSSISNLSIVLGLITIIMVAARNEFASLWAKKIDPNAALATTFFSAATVGYIMSLVLDEPLTFVFWSVLGAVGAGFIGHRSIYASAKRAEPIVLAVATPIAIIVTAIGAYIFYKEDLPHGLQLVALIIWVACGMWISFFLKTKTKPEKEIEVIDV